MASLATELTAIVKTFERPNQLDLLIRSLRHRYPELPILVADDSSTPTPRSDVGYHVLPHDVGLSAGRNYLVDRVQTEYVALFDDDHVATADTNLEGMLSRLKEHSLDIVAGDFINDGRTRFSFHGTYEFRHHVLFQHQGVPREVAGDVPLYDVVNNFFVARTDSIRRIRWDERIKFAREHADFFLRCRNQLRISFSRKFSVDHFPGQRLYLGDRGNESRQAFNRKWNVITRISVPPHVLDRRRWMLRQAVRAHGRSLLNRVRRNGVSL